MTEDGIREILAGSRLGHQVPGMQGVYTHASDRHARGAEERHSRPVGDS